ncbi:MAG: protein kinase [Pseudomonadales bacterium]|nr:protein kinase [Pseudomonadales bacterium]
MSAALQGYERLEKRAEGGMAVLYRGVQTSLNRPVAIKFLKMDIADNEHIRRLFDAESRIIARLDHPNIIRVIDRGVSASGQPYFIMDFVEGIDLKQALKTEEISHSRKLRMIIQIAKALSYAHRNGVIHRDIKPANILLDQEHNARIVDFGVAFFSGSTQTNPLVDGATVGTPAYMAPEQKEGAEFATAVSDIYSFGVMMYAIFTGKTPKGDAPLVHVLNKEIPEGLSKLVWQCMLEEPSKRPQTADEVIARVLSVIKGDHLQPQQREKAKKFTLRAHEKFILLDVLKEDDYSAVYLYENREDGGLLILKKCTSDALGYQENKMLEHLTHTNIVNVVGVTKNDRIFIAIMEYLNGGSLRSRLARPMTLKQFLPIALAIGRGLSFAHKNRVIHGNLRPANVLFTSKGSVKITDFGFKEHYEGKRKRNWYCVDGEPVSIKGDVYSGGVMFYQMLVGVRPKWALGRLTSHKRYKELPESMRRLLTVMLCRKASDRIVNYDEVLNELVQIKNASSGEAVARSDECVTIVDMPPSKSKIMVKVMGAIFFALGMAGAYAGYWQSVNGDLLPMLVNVLNIFGVVN